jgi:hypothetical protein
VEDFKNGQRIAAASVRVQGIEVTTDKFGEFSLKLPLGKQLKFQTIRAYHPKYNDFELSEVPVETSREIPIVMKPKEK